MTPSSSAKHQDLVSLPRQSTYMHPIQLQSSNENPYTARSLP